MCATYAREVFSIQKALTATTATGQHVTHVGNGVLNQIEDQTQQDSCAIIAW